MKLLLILLLMERAYCGCGLADILLDDTKIEFNQITYQHNQIKQIWSYQQDGVELSYLSVTIKNDRATINLMITHPDYRNRGLLGSLVQEMFLRNPQIKTIDAVLVETNLTVFEKIYKTLRGNETMRCILAAMQTPIYKTLKTGGIVRVSSCDYSPEIGVVRVVFTK